MAIQAPSGTQLEVPIPEMVCRVTFLNVDLLFYGQMLFSFAEQELIVYNHFQILLSSFLSESIYISVWMPLVTLVKL